VVGREDRADRRRDDIEARVVERQLLRIADQVGDVETVLAGTALRGLDEHGCEVDTGDVRAGARGALGNTAGPRSHVEPGLALVHAEPRDEVGVHVRDPLFDQLERACSPHLSLPFLQLFECHYFLLPRTTRYRRGARTPPSGVA
jgi:hypothetical protein